MKYLEYRLRAEHKELTEWVDSNTDMPAEWHHDYHAAASPLASECGVCSTFRDKVARQIQLESIIQKLDRLDKAAEVKTLDS